jgi:L-ascorbate metabolism protein UlaG (beta-lactamase superfamily)
MNRWLAAGLLFCASTPGVAQRTQDSTSGVTITFLANEGVLLSDGRKKVLVDALFLKYGPRFAVPADSTQYALENARAPFDGVDLLLATHLHGDHFQPAPVSKHLAANPASTFVAAPEVIDSLRGALSVNRESFRRAIGYLTPLGTVRREVAAGVAFEMLGLKHYELQHYGYIIELGGRRILHLGDTNEAARSFAAVGLDTLRVDIALVPAWMGTQPAEREAIRRWVRAPRIAFFHLFEDNHEATTATLRREFPDAHIFRRSLETVKW